MSNFKEANKKQRKGMISLLIIVFLFFQFFMPITEVSAANINLDVTDVILTDIDGVEIGNSNTEVDRNASIQIIYNFKIPSKVKKGDTAVLKLPNQFKIDSKIENISIDIDNEIKLADVEINTDNTVLITFTENAQTAADAILKIQSRFNEDKLGTDNRQKIIFEIKDKSTKEISINFKPKVKVQPVIDKRGEFNSSDDSIKWTIKVTPRDSLKDITLIDTLGPNQTYKNGTFEVNGVKVNPNVNENVISYKFPEGLNTEQTITLVSLIDSDTPIIEVDNALCRHLENTATLDIHDVDYIPERPGVMPSKTAEINVSDGVLEKYGLLDEDTKDKLKWVVTIKAKNSDLDNLKYTDEIQDGLSLISDTIEVVGDPRKNHELTEKGFSYKFEKIPKGQKVEITYETNITDRSRYMITDGKIASYYNVGNLESSGSIISKIHAEAPLLPEMIKKEAVGYDIGSKEVTWLVKINPMGMPIKNPKLIEEIPAGQEYVENSFQIVDKYLEGSENDDNFNDIDSISYDKESNKLIYDFNGYVNTDMEINKPYTVRLKTKVIDNKIIASNKAQLSNTAIISGNGVECESTAMQEVEDGIINKEGVSVLNDNTIKWSIEVNKNGIDIENAAIEDKLPEGINFVDKSLKVYKAVDNAELVKDVDYTFTVKDNLITVNIPKIDSCCIISFDTKVNGIAPNAENTVTIKGEGIETQTASSEKIAKIVSSGSGSATKKIKVVITKLDSADNTKKLAGAKFRLYDADKVLVPGYAEVTTGKDGTAEFSGLAKNTKYYVQESKAPSRYSLDSTFYEFTTNEDLDAAVTAYNSLIPGSTTSSHHHSSNDDDDDNGATDNNNDNDNKDINKQEKPSDLSDVIIVPSKTDTTPTENTTSEPASNENSLLEPENTESDSSKALDSQKANSSKNTLKKLPKSGSMLDEKSLVFMGLLLIFCGLTYGYRRKIRLENIKEK